MKIKFFYRTNGEKILYPYATIVNTEKYSINYSRYLLNLLVHTNDSIDFLLENIDKVQKEEEKVFERLIEIPDIYMYIYIEKVLFEHNEEYWEEWECSTSVVKKALEGWKKFLELPKNKDTTYEFEIELSTLN